MFGFAKILAVLSWVALSTAHTQIVYPGERGNNLHTNGTLPEDDPSALGVVRDANGSYAFPYGMQWIYPCMPPNHLPPQSQRYANKDAQAAVCP